MTASIVPSPGVFLAAFAIAAACMPVAKRLGVRLGVTAKRVRPGLPNGDKAPVFGGAVIVAAILISLGMFGVLRGWILFGAAALCALGLIDDAFVLRPVHKLAAQLFVLLVIVPSMPILWLTRWPASNFGLEILWLLATINAFNLIDGLDGLATGVGIVTSMALVTAGILHPDPLLACGAVALAGALAAFLLYNFYPASIFMGDAGALPVGFLLGAFALEGAALATNSRLTKYVFPVLIMLMPLLDTAIVSVTRMATGKAISGRGSDHSHHRLLSLGLSERRTVVICWAVALVSSACAVAASVLPHVYVLTALPFIALASAVIAMFMMDLTFASNPPGIAYYDAKRVARFILSFGYKRRIVEATADLALISAAYFGAYLIRLDFQLNADQVNDLIHCLPWILLVTYAAFLLAGIYRGIWRYTGLPDGIRFANGAVLAGIFIVGASRVAPIAFSGSILFLYVIILFNLLVATRVSFQVLHRAINYLRVPVEGVLVVGAGIIGTAAATFLSSERGRNFNLVGFVDNDGFKQGKLVDGHQVLGSVQDLARIFRSKPFDELLIASEDISDGQLAQVRAFAQEHKLTVRRFLIQMNDLSDLLT